MRHVPAVHAMEGRKIVVCEPGEELLYPSAESHMICERANDDDRRDLISKDKGIDVIESNFMCKAKSLWATADFRIFRTSESMPRAYFKPESDYDPGMFIDVVICPRLREYGKEKNWPHWNRLAWLIGNRTDIRYPVAIGAPDSSDLSVTMANWPPCTQFDDMRDRDLAAAVACLTNARLCIATDAGLAHLAMWCGCPLLLISDGPECRVAPGPVLNGDGSVAYDQYWPIKLDRYRAQNHLGADLMVVANSLNNPELVCETALAYLEHGVTTCP